MTSLPSSLQESIKEKEQGDSEYDAEMAGKVRDKLKRSNNDREPAIGDNIENVFSYNRSKKRKLVPVCV